MDFPFMPPLQEAENTTETTSNNFETDKDLIKKIKKYKNLTKKAIKEIRLNTHLSLKEKKIGKDFIQMCESYFKDGEYFEKQNNKLTALAAYSYAHAWLDAGVRAGLLNAKNNSKLFTLK